MPLRQNMVVGNWKMNGNVQLAHQLVEQVSNHVDTISSEIVICPPTVFIESVSKILTQSSLSNSELKFSVGAQNASQYEKGAHTGEISVEMLKDSGCDYIIIGHSERRQMYGDTDLIVANKFSAIQKQGLIPIFCVGEQLEAREANKTFNVIAEQLEVVIQKNGIESFANAIIAYEPVWAIGTGKSATPEQAQEVHEFIRESLSKYSAVIAEKVRILYGGSVTPVNAAEIFAQPDVDGGLIGGASLKPADFISLCNIQVSK